MQSSAPDDGRKYRPKHIEPTWNNKLIYIVHLVGYFIGRVVTFFCWGLKIPTVKFYTILVDKFLPLNSI